MTEPKPPKMVVVEWDDAWSETKAIKPDDPRFEQGYPGFQTGYLKSADDKFVVVCREWWPGLASEDEPDPPHYAFCTSIARSLVRSVTLLRKAGEM